MLERRVYVYFKQKDKSEVISFLNVYEEFELNELTENYLEIIIKNTFDLETIIKARDFIMVELYQDITVFICPINLDHKIKNEILEFLPKLNHGIYLMENLIYESIKANETILVGRIRDYYYNRFSPETIETILGFIDQDMNASKTAKALYMHRNTLNYRLDNFINKTEINVRTFKGALAIYLLFKR